MLGIKPILLSELRNKNPEATALLVDELKHRGFGLVTIDDDQMHAVLEDGLMEAQRLKGFRFPPHDTESAEYTAVTRGVFRSLFKISVTIFTALCGQYKLPQHLRSALSEAHSQGYHLFTDKPRHNEPFEHGQAFNHSFFNLFNYDGGALNPHYDRSLLTVVKAKAGQDSRSAQSALWIRDNHAAWQNADKIVSDEQVIVMIGEDSERMQFAQLNGLFAAEHAVRVDPKGEYISHSHHRRDPETTTAQNRTSAAFILRHDPSSD